MKINDKTKEELKHKLQPDTFITLTVCQGIMTKDGKFIVASPLALDRVMKGVLDATARRIYSKRYYRRKRPRIKNISVAECSRGGMWHIHSCLKCPDNVTIEQLAVLIEDAWSKSKWYRPRNEIEQIWGNALFYILKDGQDGFLVDTMSF